MTDVPNRLFDKIAIDLVSDLNVSASGNQDILTTINGQEISPSLT